VTDKSASGRLSRIYFGFCQSFDYKVSVTIIVRLAIFVALLALPLETQCFGQESVPIPSNLRGGDVKCDQATINLALELTQQGWKYVMPEPKSPQAAWGNPDGRTTWFVGYWINKTSQHTSSDTPVKNADGAYIGDDKGFGGWRRGGTPPPPTKLQWLCSTSGGVSPE
jgi:hypothetical protein